MMQGHGIVSQDMLRLGLGLGQAFTASALGALICIPDASLCLFLSLLCFFPRASKFICCLICAVPGGLNRERNKLFHSLSWVVVCIPNWIPPGKGIGYTLPVLHLVFSPSLCANTEYFQAITCPSFFASLNYTRISFF